MNRELWTHRLIDGRLTYGIHFDDKVYRPVPLEKLLISGTQYIIPDNGYVSVMLYQNNQSIHLDHGVVTKITYNNFYDDSADIIVVGVRQHKLASYRYELSIIHGNYSGNILIVTDKFND